MVVLQKYTSLKPILPHLSAPTKETPAIGAMIWFTNTMLFYFTVKFNRSLIPSLIWAIQSGYYAVAAVLC
jgi:hypothetical protein